MNCTIKEWIDLVTLLGVTSISVLGLALVVALIVRVRE